MISQDLKNQKASLTREIKETQNYLNDLREARKTQGNNSFFYYLGEKLSIYFIDKIAGDLSVLRFKREKLNHLNVN